MNQNNYSEIIDAYLRGQLAETDKLKLEQLASQDPLVKSELHLQQDIIEAIRLNREKELKQRLNALPVKTAPMFPRVASLSASVALFGTLLISGTVLSILVSFEPDPKALEKKQKQQLNATKTEKLIRKPETNIQEQPIREMPVIAEMPVLALKTDEVEEKQANEVTVGVSQNDKAILATRQVVNSKQYELAQVSNDLQKQKLTTLRFAKKPLDKSASQISYYQAEQDKRVYDGQNEESLESIATKNKLSYQYYDDMLFMYNNVSRGEKVKLEENGLNRHFLYYEGSFYELNENQIEATEMSPVRNKKLINKLNDLINE